MKAASKVVQLKNPRTGRYVKVDRSKGEIVSVKSTPGPYKNVPIFKRASKRSGK
jgi:hypothetical protein